MEAFRSYWWYLKLFPFAKYNDEVARDPNKIRKLMASPAPDYDPPTKYRTSKTFLRPYKNGAMIITPLLNFK